MRGFFAVGTAVAAVAGATVAALAGAGSALATTPTPVTIEVKSVFATYPPGTFTTSGAGLCPSGTTTDLSPGTGFPSGFLAIVHDRKTFTCADGSGTFTADVQAHEIFGSGTDSFTWSILTGTGAYTNLRGSGNGVGVFLATELDDHFVGAVQFN